MFRSNICLLNLACGIHVTEVNISPKFSRDQTNGGDVIRGHSQTLFHTHSHTLFVQKIMVLKVEMVKLQKATFLK